MQNRSNPPGRSLSIGCPRLLAVGGAGLCVSTVAVHRQMAAGTVPSCSAAAAASTVAAPGLAGESKHLEGEEITVYQYKICPFCNKLKVVMDFLGIPYSVTEVSTRECFTCYYSLRVVPLYCCLLLWYCCSIVLVLVYDTCTLCAADCSFSHFPPVVDG